MVNDDFEKMELEAGPRTTVLEPPDRRVLPSNGAFAYRKKLLEDYHGGAKSLVARLRSSGNDDIDSLLLALIDEIINETENLLGNHLIATENGDLRDASVISFKRAEVLEKAIKALQSKQQIEKESGIDVNSPSMMVVFRYFMGKAKITCQTMDMAEEQTNLFFQTLAQTMKNWQKELREEFEALKSRN